VILYNTIGFPGLKRGGKTMKWIEVKVITTHEAVETISNILHESGAGGVVIEDPQDFKDLNDDNRNWDYYDESLLNVIDETAIIKAYLSESADLLDEINLIKDRIDLLADYNINVGKGEITTSDVYEEDWATAWKKHYKPTKVGENIIIKPTWEQYQKEPKEIIIELDPGMAFGTGTHETTRLCIEFLESYVKEKDIVLDIGTGSGILGITAAKLGSEKVIGVDFDTTAIRVAKENIIVNKVENIVEIREGNLLHVIHEKADIVVANIIADTIIELSKDMNKFLKKDGIFIASGIILDRIEDVKKALKKENFKIVSIKTMGEWTAICCTL
jgi:ribosomal protein L11 methyltransferase